MKKYFFFAPLFIAIVITASAQTLWFSGGCPTPDTNFWGDAAANPPERTLSTPISSISCSGTGSSDKYTNWNISINLDPGTNHFKVYSENFGGNFSTTDNVTIDLK